MISLVDRRSVKRQHHDDLARGCGRVVLPVALDRKYASAPIEWGWQFVFPAPAFGGDPISVIGDRWAGAAGTIVGRRLRRTDVTLPELFHLITVVIFGDGTGTFEGHCARSGLGSGQSAPTVGCRSWLGARVGRGRRPGRGPEGGPLFVGRHSSGVFAKPPGRQTVEEMKNGIRRYIKKRHAGR